jgi:hypothetical protein
MTRRPISLVCIAFSGHCERIVLLTPRRHSADRPPGLAPDVCPLPQVWRRDCRVCVHFVPQDSGCSSRFRGLLLYAVLLLHRRQTAIRDDRPIRPPDVQPDMSVLVSLIAIALVT